MLDARQTAELELGAPCEAPPLTVGDPAPWFFARSDVNARFKFSTLGGRRVALVFLDSFSSPEGKPIVEAFQAEAMRLAPFTTAVVLVSADEADAGAVAPADRQMRYFFDSDRAIARLFFGPPASAGPATFLLDERLRIAAFVRTRSPEAHVEAVMELFHRLAPLAAPRAAVTPQAPVLIIPDVFERALCGRLVSGYEANGGAESGYMIERDGKTVGVVDHGHKRRSDWTLEDAELIRACHRRVSRRISPEIRRAYQFDVTRIERNLVACYRADQGGHFARHRDNTTKGTAHRRFAVSINLNAEDYEGGDLCFPEFGLARFRPPTGGACVFSCSLMHEATPVTKGVRYVFVPFLYDEGAAEMRRENLQYLTG